MAELRVVSPGNSVLHRIGWGDDPWAWADWSTAGQEGRFDGRWDDPLASYRVLYAASERVATFVEVLAARRALAPSLAAELDEIDEPEPGIVTPGVLPGSWAALRSIGMAKVPGVFADITHSDSIAYLRSAMGATARALGIATITVAHLMGDDKRFPQAVSRHVYELTEDAQPRFAGIKYPSKHGAEFDLWAIFEHPGDADVQRIGGPGPIDLDDPNLQDACTLHGIVLDRTL